MKKILLFLLTFFPIISYWNWDAVRSLDYWANFNSPFDVNIEVINEACWTNKNYSWNIFSNLNVNWKSWTSCYKSWWKVLCNISKPNWDDRSWTLKSWFYLVWNRAQILSWMWVESKIYNNFNSTYVHNIESDFWLLTDSNWNNRFSPVDYSLNTWVKKLFNCSNTIRYFDNTECKDLHKKFENVEITNWSWETIIEKREMPFEPKFYVNTDTSCSSSVVNYSNPITPPTISNDISIEWCFKKWDIYYCKSSTSAFKLNFKITNWWTNNWVNFLNFNINNENNTQNISRKSYSNFMWVWNNSINIILPKLKWNYTIEFSWYWKNWDGQTLSNLVTKKLVIIPNNNFSFSSWNLEKISWTNVYANNNDEYKYCKLVTDSNLNTLTSLTRDLKVNVKSWYKTNRVSNTWDEALKLNDFYFDKNTSKACVEFAWLAPYEWDISFDFKLSKHDDFYESYINDYKDLWYKIVSNIKFLKPFTWKISASRDDNNYNYNPEIGTLMKYKFEAVNSTSNISTSNFKFSYSSNPNIILIWNYLEKQDFQISNLIWKESSFEWRINYTWTDKVSTIKPALKIENAVIEYELDNKIIKYYISELTSPNDNTPVKIEFDEAKINNSFIWVKIIWGIKWEWNQEITWQDVNISELNSYEVRTKIRKNAYDFTKSLTTGSTINGVHYVNWDYTLNNSSPNFETLVVKNWNLTIATNINKQKFWIIVLSDWYNVANWKNNKWNIFIKPNVTNINWLLYADWWIMSVWSDDKLLSTDSFSRTKNLQNQLYIKWSIITRNTIWWAVLTNNWNYVLPWKQTTNDFDLAMIFDLNYLRRWDIWTTLENKWYSTVIEYNPWLVLDAPKLFNN